MDAFAGYDAAFDKPKGKIMPRFRLGDRVRILPNTATPFVNLQGTIHDIQPHQLNVRTLDRYIVTFEWGERQPFYDAQLGTVHTPHSDVILNTSNVA